MRELFRLVTSFAFVCHPSADFHNFLIFEKYPIQQNYPNNNLESENSSNEDILNVSSRTSDVTSARDNIDDLVFRHPSIINPTQTSTADGSVKSQVPIDQQKKSHHLNEHNKKLSNINTCKGLQRKLEQKVERAKKNFLHNEKVNQMENDDVSLLLRDNLEMILLAKRRRSCS